MNEDSQKEKLFEAADALGQAITEIINTHLKTLGNRMAAMPVEPLVSKKEVAKHLGVQVRTVDNWIGRGYIPYYKVGRSVRFRLSDVQAHLDQRHRIDRGGSWRRRNSVN